LRGSFDDNHEHEDIIWLDYKYERREKFVSASASLLDRERLLVPISSTRYSGRPRDGIVITYEKGNRRFTQSILPYEDAAESREPSVVQKVGFITIHGIYHLLLEEYVCHYISLRRPDHSIK